MVQTFTFIRPVQLLNFCSKSSLHCQRNLKLCFFFLSFKPHAANVPTYGVIGAKSYIHIHTRHLGSKRFHGSYHVWCRKFSSGDPMAVHARCGQWESRGDTMHLFVSFFFSFLRSFCKGLQNINCDRHVHTSWQRLGKEAKNIAFLLASNTSELGHFMQLRKPGGHKDVLNASSQGTPIARTTKTRQVTGKRKLGVQQAMFGTCALESCTRKLLGLYASRYTKLQHVLFLPMRTAETRIRLCFTHEIQGLPAKH